MKLLVISKSTPAHIVLGIEPDADADTIRRAFRKLALKYHPDHNKSPDAEFKMQEINAAYAAMKDGNYSYANGSTNNGSTNDDFANKWANHNRRARDRAYNNRDRERYSQNSRNNSYRKPAETWYWDLVDNRLGNFKWEYKGVRKGVRNIVTNEISDLHFHYTIRKSKDGMYVARELSETSEVIDRFKSFINAAKTCATYARSQHIIRTQGETPPVVTHKYDKEPEVSTYDHKYLRDWEWRLLERKQPLWMTTLYLDLDNPTKNTHTFYIAKYTNGFYYVFNGDGKIWLDKKYKTAMNAARSCAKSLQKLNIVPSRISHNFENANAAFDKLRLIRDYPELLKDRGFSRY